MVGSCGALCGERADKDVSRFCGQEKWRAFRRNGLAGRTFSRFAFEGRGAVFGDEDVTSSLVARRSARSEKRPFDEKGVSFLGGGRQVARFPGELLFGREGIYLLRRPSEVGRFLKNVFGAHGSVGAKTFLFPASPNRSRFDCPHASRRVDILRRGRSPPRPSPELSASFADAPLASRNAAALRSRHSRAIAKLLGVNQKATQLLGRRRNARAKTSCATEIGGQKGIHFLSTTPMALAMCGG